MCWYVCIWIRRCVHTSMCDYIYVCGISVCGYVDVWVRLLYVNNLYVGTSVCGNVHVWVGRCVVTSMDGHAYVCVRMCGNVYMWIRLCVGTSLCGYVDVLERLCVPTLMCGHIYVWEGRCVGTCCSFDPCVSSQPTATPTTTRFPTARRCQNPTTESSQWTRTPMTPSRSYPPLLLPLLQSPVLFCNVFIFWFFVWIVLMWEATLCPSFTYVIVYRKRNVRQFPSTCSHPLVSL